jgi:predicted thioesterase
MDVGARAEVTRVVGDADTASALGSGSLPVLGTPRLLAWFEEATCRAVDDALATGETTVGTSVRLDHLAPSGVGATVTVRAEVAAVDGRRVTLTVEATDAGGTLVGRGTVERVVVDARRFLDRLEGP